MYDLLYLGLLALLLTTSYGLVQFITRLGASQRPPPQSLQPATSSSPQRSSPSTPRGITTDEHTP